MFTNKLNSLFEVPVKKGTSKSVSNSFIDAGLLKSARTRSGNDALKYSTTGNDFVDQFGKLGSYKEQRSFTDISRDTQTLWSQNPRLTICFIFFIRLITRVVSLFSGTKTGTVQRGSGLKHEGIMRMIWLHINAPDSFWKNIKLYIAIASWKDIFQMLQIDLQYNGWDNRQLDWCSFSTLIMAGLENSNTTNLVKKYLPQIKARSKCTTLQTQSNTLIGKWLCSEFDCNYKDYRMLKTSGTAHQWQKLISQRLFDKINFNSIHGRALALMVSSKFLVNHGLEKKYEEWITTQPIAKYTGYVHELLSKISHNMKKYVADTINKQFAGLVELGKKNAKTDSRLIVVRDTSASMGAPAHGTNVSCYDIGKSLALYFSEFLTGHFAGTWIEFNDKAKMHTWKGNTPVEKWLNDHSNYVGSTEFQSVIDLFIRIKQEGVSEADFPTGILCISDGEFNPSRSLSETNVKNALERLLFAGFSDEYVHNFQIILWNLQSKYYGKGTGEKFETYGDVENVYYFSGYDPAIIAFLTGVEGQTKTPKTAKELFEAAMDQEVMSMIEV